MFVFKYFILIYLIVSPLLAHQSRENYINVAIEKKQIVLTCDIETDNFAKVISLDDNGNNIVSWGELTANEDAITGVFLENLSIVDGEEKVSLSVASVMIHRRDDQSYLRLVLKGTLKRREVVRLNYKLFFDLDPLQRVFVVINKGKDKRSMLLTPSQRDVVVYGKKVTLWQQFSTFFREGVEHIWSGYDHLLFLLMLTLPLFLQAKRSITVEENSPKKALFGIVKIVTLFSLAHSLTLGVAFFDIARVNVKVIESLITLSIIITALFNLFNYTPQRIYLLVFSFGLLHGFGFANALSTLALGNTHMLLSLLGFNLGVEVGQIALVLVATPLLYLASRKQDYYRLMMQLLSLSTVILGCYWLMGIVGL